MNKQVRADLMLMLVTLCWGISYYLSDISLAEMDPFTLNTYRFIGAFVLVALLSFRRIKTVNRVTLKYSLLVGIALVFVYIGSTFGLKYTSLSNSGFLCALTVVFTPLIGWIVLRQRLEKKMWVSVLLCLVGIMFLTLKDDFSLNMAHLKGDLLCMLCAVAYAVDLLLTEKAVNHAEVDAYQLGVFQLGFTGLFNLIMAFITETPVLPQSPQVWGAVIFLAVFCTGLAFVVQPIAQQYTSASHVGVIFALEPVFAGIVAFFLAGEVLSPKAYLGAVLMVVSIFVMEIDFRQLLKKRQNAEEPVCADEKAAADEAAADVKLG